MRTSIKAAIIANKLWVGEDGGVAEDAAASVNAPYSGLTSHWSLEDSGRDYYYGLHNGVKLNGTMTPTTGKVGNCYTFSSGGLQVLPAANLSFGDGAGNDEAFSYSFWIYPTESAANRFIITKQTGSVFEYQVLRDTTGRIGFAVYTTGANYLYKYTNSGFAINNWHHVVVTYDASKTIGGLLIYVNGVAQATTTASAGSYTGMPANTGNFCIGNFGHDPVNASGFRGKIDSVTLFPTAIAQAQIDLLYNSGNGVALTSNTVVPNTALTYERGIFVLATNGNYQLGTDNVYLYWSDDAGETWINQYNWGTQQNLALPVYNKAIDMAHIFSDASVIFSCGALLYRSADKLLNIVAITAYEADGTTPFTIHTPSNAARPGCYFAAYSMGKVHEQVNGSDIFVWGNYCNNTDAVMGAAPVTIWYTIDNGVTVKAAYKFGQNPNKRDDGSAGGGATGTLLGDSGNPLYTRHVHTVIRRPGTLDWYSFTGDTTLTEIHWLKHTYNDVADTWSTTNVLVNQTPNKWFVSDAMFPAGGDGSELYWCPDSTTVSERGLFKTAIANFGVSATNLKDFGGSLIPSNLYVKSTGKTVISFVGSQISVSDDFMSTQTDYTIVDAGAADSNRIINTSPPDTRNYLKFTLGGFWFLPRKTIFIKV